MNGDIEVRLPSSVDCPCCGRVITTPWTIVAAGDELELTLGFCSRRCRDATMGKMLRIYLALTL